LKGWRSSSRHPLENGVWWIGDYQMLETSQERVKLLKGGIDGKTIEKLYLIYNNFQIVPTAILFELVEIYIEDNDYG